MSVHRLGDIIDDYCTRCRLLTNHSVAVMIGEEIKKVRCRTCDHEHVYRHGKGGTKKKTRLSAYEQVLASILAGKPGAPAPSPPEPVKSPARSRMRPLSSRTRPHPSR